MMMSGFWSFMVPESATTPERPGCDRHVDVGSGAWGTPVRSEKHGGGVNSRTTGAINLSVTQSSHGCHAIEIV
jgi:hypothetical protein